MDREIAQPQTYRAMRQPIDYSEDAVEPLAPYDVRQAEAARLEAGARRDEFAEFREQVYQEEFDKHALRTDIKIESTAGPAMHPVTWHQRQMRESELLDRSRRGADPSYVGQAEVVESDSVHRTLEAERLEEANRRAASSRIFQINKELRRLSAQGDTGFQSPDAQELVSELSELTAKFPKVRHHSAELPEPLDFETPRALQRNFRGIQSDRTYGLEIELITDAPRAEMESLLEYEMGQGLALKYDMSLKTARTDVAIEHHPPRSSFRDIHRIEAQDFRLAELRHRGPVGTEAVRPK